MTLSELAFKSYPKPDYWAGLFDGEGHSELKELLEKPWLSKSTLVISSYG
jgi:hypothetical protein